MADRDSSFVLPGDGSVVVVGGSLAGARAIEALRGEGFSGTITLVGEEQHLPYDRPPLSKQVLAGDWPPERARLLDQGKLDELAVVKCLGCRAVSLDAAARRVELDDGGVLQGDGIVIATGAKPRWLPGLTESTAVQVLRTVDDSIRLHRRVRQIGPGCRVVVIGAGFIGSEVASTCRGLDCEVDVVEMLETPLEPALGQTIGSVCAGLHTEHGVRLHTGTAVSAVHTEEDVESAKVILSDGSALLADVVVVGIGVAPATSWLQGSGLRVDDGVKCDERLFAAPGIVAAGDLARWPHRAIGKEIRVEHWQVAAEAGVAAARSLLHGTKAPPFEPVPYFWSDQYGARIQMLGLPAPDDELVVVDGDLESRRFVALYGRDGRLTAALGLSRPRQLMGFRALLARQADLHEAVAIGRD